MNLSLWHILSNYSAYSFNERVIHIDLKGDLSAKYFANKLMHMSDSSLQMKLNSSEAHYKG